MISLLAFHWDQLPADISEAAQFKVKRAAAISVSLPARSPQTISQTAGSLLATSPAAQSLRCISQTLAYCLATSAAVKSRFSTWLPVLLVGVAAAVLL